MAPAVAAGLAIGGDRASWPDRRLARRISFDHLTARADVGGNAGNACSTSLEDRQGLRFGDRGEHVDVDPAEPIRHFDAAAQGDGVLEAELADQGGALAGVGWIFFERAEDLALRVRYLTPQQADGADERLYVLDGHDAADQRDRRGPGRGVARDRAVLVEIDAVGNDRAARRHRAIAKLQALVAPVEGDDRVRRLVGQAGKALERLDPQIAQVADHLAGGERRLRPVIEPVGHRDLDSALVGVDAVLGQDELASCGGRETGTEQPGETGRDCMVATRIGYLRQQNGQDGAREAPPRPEVIEERRVGTAPLVARPHRCESDPAIEEECPTGGAVHRVDVARDRGQVVEAGGAGQQLIDEGEHVLNGHR